MHKNRYNFLNKRNTLDDSLSTCNHANKVSCSSSSNKVSDSTTVSTQTTVTSQTVVTKAGGCSQANYRTVPGTGCSKFCHGGVAKECGPGLKHLFDLELFKYIFFFLFN